MKLLADEKIPHIKNLFSDDFCVELISDHDIKQHALTDIDVLITRATVKLDHSLLKNSRVKVVASPTSGIDHMQTDWLEHNKIHWLNSPGCNANAVAEYVVCCVASLQQKGLLHGLKAGVIGVGHVGSRVVNQLKNLGFDVLQNDPPRAESDPSFQSTPLSQFTDLDLICLHTPLTRQGSHPSYHLIEKNFLRRQKHHAVLLNAGRGAVIKTVDLLNHGQHLYWCLDVFDHEPVIEPELLQQALIATPHIAGYSQQAKNRGITMIYQGICDFFNIKPQLVLATPIKNKVILNKDGNWQNEVLKIFDPAPLTAELKSSHNTAETFLKLRNNYIFREEFTS